MRPEVIKASVCVFIASFCTLVIELVAGRILAPHVGVSLYTWTSIIGVVLAGISLGAYLGGLLADRFPRPGTLGWLLSLSGLAAFSIGPLADLCGGGSWLGGHGIETSLMTRVLILTTLIFFVPALILGMISPVVVRLAVNNLEKTGNVVGKIYAFSTLGSILGTFATGFFLVAYLGTRLVLFSVGLVLVVCAPIFGEWLARKPGPRAALLVLCAGVLLGWLAVLVRVPVLEEAWLHAIRFPTQEYPLGIRLYGLIAKPYGAHRPDWPYYYYKESDYYTIKLSSEPRDDGGGVLEVLTLDHLNHSYSDVADPFYLKYEYLTIYDEIISWQQTRRPKTRTLFIGGGGYTFPRMMELKHPQAELDVVEIDPEVTRAARRFLGIGPGSRIRSFNMDGRWYVMNCKESYDFIIGEAFNDVSIPYHLTTREFAGEMKAILKPDGLLIALVIDSIKDGQFMASYVRTLEEAFGKGHVHLVTCYRERGRPVALNENCDNIGVWTHVIVAGRQKLDLADFKSFRQTLAARCEATRKLAAGALAVQPLAGLAGALPAEFLVQPLRSPNHVVKPELFQRYLQKRGGVVLTDDYAPVDFLIAPLFEERFRAR